MNLLYPYPAEIVAEIDARLEAIDPRFAEHNRQLAPHSPSLQKIADSGLTMCCPKCGQSKPLLAFPVVDRPFSSDMPLEKNIRDYACWECLYQQALTKLRANGNLKKNPVSSCTYVPVQHAVRDGWIVYGTCFCGEQATAWHHYSYAMPLVGQCYCKKHHHQLHHVIRKVWRDFGYIPPHQKRLYYIPKLDKVTGKFVQVPRPESAAVIAEAQQIPTFRQQMRLERDRQVAQMKQKHLNDLIKRFGKKGAKMVFEAYLAKRAAKSGRN